MPHSLEDLAKAADCHWRTLHRWLKAGAPRPADGEDLAAWAPRYRQWVEGHRKRPPKREPAPPTNGKLDPLDRNRTAAAELKELQLARERGELVEQKVVAAQWRTHILAVRQKLLALPNTIAGRCANSPPEVVKAEAMALILEALEEFAADGGPAPE